MQVTDVLQSDGISFESRITTTERGDQTLDARETARAQIPVFDKWLIEYHDRLTDLLESNRSRSCE